MVKIIVGLTRDLNSAEKSLNFLEQTVKMVETRPSQFEHISGSELKNRKEFLQKTKLQLDKMQHQLASRPPQLPRLQQPVPKSKSKQDWERENTDFIVSEKQRQQEIISEQDDNLDMLGKSVAQLGQVAVGINQEIDVQNK